MFRNGLQFWHIVVLLLVVLVLFGANKLPDVARSVGKSMKILKEEVKDLRDEPAPTPGAVTPPPSVTPPATGPAAPSGAAEAPRTRDESTGGPGATAL